MSSPTILGDFCAVEYTSRAGASGLLLVNWHTEACVWWNVESPNINIDVDPILIPNHPPYNHTPKRRTRASPHSACLFLLLAEWFLGPHPRDVLTRPHRRARLDTAGPRTARLRRYAALAPQKHPTGCTRPPSPPRRLHHIVLRRRRHQRRRNQPPTGSC
ncbi:hypothetical protein C8R43DRAFT_80427 [Mycena crocata]|nr:hypothetical protein C8R43DRAFT_80427 [Mycena crocata]